MQQAHQVLPALLTNIKTLLILQIPSFYGKIRPSNKHLGPRRARPYSSASTGLAFETEKRIQVWSLYPGG